MPILAALAMVLALLTTPASAATGDGPGVKIAGSGDAQEAATGVVTGFIVADPPGKGGVNTEAVLARAEATLGVALAPGHGIGFGLSTVKLAQPVTVAQAEQMSARWKASGQVSQVQPDYPTFLADASTGASDVSTQAVQGSAPWGLDRIDQRSGLDGRYSYSSTGVGITAYVLDTGIRASHSQFGGRVLPGAYAIYDGRGSGDCNGHGTHVAGIIGGSTYGVAKGVTLVPVRVMGCGGSGYNSDAIAGINWIVSNHPYSTPAVLNISLGSSLDFAFDRAATAAVNDNITVTIASGNSGQNACNFSPAGASGTITVNWARYPDDDAPNSNFGPCTDIYAPGEMIPSAYYRSDTDAVYMSGTSMAAPHVAGAAARILSTNRAYTTAQIKYLVKVTATPVNFLPSDSSDAKGLLYVSPALAGPVAPGAPTLLSATPGNGSAVLAFAAPASNGGAAITNYQYSLNNGAAWANRSPASASSPFVVTGLANGTTYQVRVRAVNSAGAGAASSAVAVTPRTVPGAPTVASVTPGSRTLRIVFRAPSSNGGAAITTYQYSLNNGASWAIRSPASTASPLVVTGLTPGTTYQVRLRAVNAAGAGAASNAVPGQPRA